VDAGCGQGHFLQYCALAGFRPLLGFDPSMRGLRRASSALSPEIALVQARAEQLPVRACQAIVALDVLYLLDQDKQETFLARASVVLPPGGVLLIKTMDPERRLRQLLNRAQEHVAVKMLHITMGDTFHFRTCTDWVALCERLGFHARVVPLWRGYLHPHVLIAARRAAQTAVEDRTEENTTRQEVP
jgi:SAM-dependent methyltransferase